ncbi:MAG: FAD-dependent oxidoreductase [Janthinobacterium lividum]
MPGSNDRIVIVGAGPTGLALAAELQRLGTPALLFEKKAAPPATSRAVIVHARTLEVLEPLGVAQRVIERGLPLNEARMHEGDTTRMHVSFDGLNTAYPYALALPQDQTEAVLTGRLRELGEAVTRSVEVTGIDADSTGATLTYTAAGVLVQHIRAGWVIGCDGLHSTVRQAAGIEFEGGTYDENFVLGDVEMDFPLERNGMDLFFAPTGFLLIVPLPGNRYRVFATVREPGGSPSMEDLQKLLDERGPQMNKARIRSMAWSSHYRIQHRVASTLRSGRMIVLGDAAHVHSPAGGQGMNTGIQDAVSLAGVLHRVITTGDEAPLAEWEKKRLEIARSVVRTTDLMTRAATSDSSVSRILRNALMGVVDHIPALQHGIAERLSEIDNR